MKIKYPLKVTIRKNSYSQQWVGRIQYAPKESIQANYSLMNAYCIYFYAKTKKEVQEWVRQYKKEKRYIKDRKNWLSREKHYTKKEVQQKAINRHNKMSRVFSNMGY